MSLNHLNPKIVVAKHKNIKNNKLFTFKELQTLSNVMFAPGFLNTSVRKAGKEGLRWEEME